MVHWAKGPNHLVRCENISAVYSDRHGQRNIFNIVQLAKGPKDLVKELQGHRSELTSQNCFTISKEDNGETAPRCGVLVRTALQPLL